MKIEIWSDIACPWCYVGKRRFERALGSFSHRDEVEVVWRSFELDPAAERGYSKSQPELLAAKYGVSLERAKEMDASMTAEAKKEGLDFHFDRVRVGNTFDAHRLIHFAATFGLRDAMVERLFRAYLTDGAMIGDRAVLAGLAADVGLDPGGARDVLESAAFADEVRADEQRARELGINGVPFFAIDERYGVSGAQQPELLLDALREAWNDATPALVAAPAAGDGCEDGSCAV